MRETNISDRLFSGCMRLLAPRAVLVLVFLLAGWLAHGEALAAALTVTNLNDSGAGSLRQAIADSNAGDWVVFGVTGTITLTSGELAISKDLTISGPGSPYLTVSGNNASRVFNISGGTINILNITISGGNASSGGGIHNSGGSVYVTSSVVSGNAATNYGGGIMSETYASIVNSTVANNTASLGGGLFNGGSGTMTMSGSTISGNNSTSDGGGIRSYGTLHVSSSTLVSGNTSSASGGGIVYPGQLILQIRSLKITAAPTTAAEWLSMAFSRFLLRQ